jgi:hypothetical protein
MINSSNADATTGPERKAVESGTRDAPIGRRVVCAAIRAANGELVLGIRHYSADMRIQLAMRTDEGRPFMNRSGDDQGFVDQFGEYMTREEAFVVAVAANQIVRGFDWGSAPTGPKLYSEGLY